MATVFPGQIQTFPTMMDLVAADMANVKNYQEAMQAGNFTLAASYLSQISNADKKLVNAEYLNTIVDTIQALETYYEQRWSPAYVVSASQPVTQSIGDFWFAVQ